MPESKLWVDRLPRPQKSEIIIIRHGESKYTGGELDLTEKGKEQVRETAEALKDHLAGIESIVAISSPAPRAMNTAKLFLETTGIDHEEDLKLEDTIRPLEIKDLRRFLDYDREHSTQNYGEMWLTDPTLAEDNPLTEGRRSVNRRAEKFLHDYGRELAAIAEETGVVAAALVFTHMEVGINFLQGITPEVTEFPIRRFPALENAEPIVIQLDDPQQDEYTVIARGTTSRVRYNTITKSFMKRE